MPSILNATTSSGLVTSADNSGSLQLQTNNGTTAVTIDTSQNVGIGTSSPSGAAGRNLTIYNSSGQSRVAFKNSVTGDAAGDGFQVGIDGDGMALVEQRENLAMSFATNATERMRIDSSGNVGIGANTVSTIKTYVSAASNQAVLYARAENTSQTQGVFQVEAARNTTNNTFYAIQYYNAGAGTDRFRVADSGNVTNSNGSYGTISDAKNKENIVDATPKLDKLNQLQVRNFNFKNDDLKQIGFVAQEFEQVFPSMVEEHLDKDAEGNDLGTTTKSIKTSVLVPILVKAIQELNEKVEAQAVRIAELEGAK